MGSSEMNGEARKRVGHWDADAAKRVGQWIRDARDQQGWRSNQTFAVAAGISSGTLSALETGQTRKKGYDHKTLGGVERALNVSPGTLERVASGEDVPLEDVEITTTDAQSADQLARLDALFDDVLMTLRKMDKRLAALERRADDQDR